MRTLFGPSSPPKSFMYGKLQVSGPVMGAQLAQLPRHVGCHCGALSALFARKGSGGPRSRRWNSGEAAAGHGVNRCEYDGVWGKDSGCTRSDCHRVPF